MMKNFHFWVNYPFKFFNKAEEKLQNPENMDVKQCANFDHCKLRGGVMYYSKATDVG